MHVNAMQAAPAQTTEADAAKAIAPAQTNAELQALKQAAVKFESFFVAQMMQQMRKATAAMADADSPLNDQVNQAPLAMADNAVADNLASTGAFGIADVLVRQMAGPLQAGALAAAEVGSSSTASLAPAAAHHRNAL